MTQSDLPAFGEADLSNCEREQIHLAGSIQPHGALLVLDETGAIVQHSANAEDLLGGGKPLLGRALDDVSSRVARFLRGLPATGARPIKLPGVFTHGALELEARAHRTRDGHRVVEFERAAPAARRRGDVEKTTQAILASESLRALADRTTALVGELTGYDRVMVYRFDELGHGEVFAERRHDHLEAFLGNRYPASDIPQMARRLYLQNRVRLLVDVDYEPVALVPRLCPLSGRDLDMSLCDLRSMSPIHLQYLKNMGVKATLVVSLVVGGELWGLIACHHYEARAVSAETRAYCELIGELVATRIAALQNIAQTQAELAVRRLEREALTKLSCDGAWQAALLGSSRTLLEILDASGVALVERDAIHSAGTVPEPAELRELAAWLDEAPRQPLYASAALAREAPRFVAILPIAAGVLSIPLSNDSGEYLLWFRPERRTTVTWGGNPAKPVIVGKDPRQLSPRLSFAQWVEVVEGTAEPWTRTDQMTAKLAGEAVRGLALRARATRILAAQDLLDRLTRQIRSTTKPLLLADVSGRITLMTEAFSTFLDTGQSPPPHLVDTTRLFEQSYAFVAHIDNLLRRDTPFEVEAELASMGREARSVSIKGAAVLAEDGRKLGYMLQFEELADRKTAEAARVRFEDALAIHRRAPAGRLDLGANAEFGAACAKMVENARLAAIEITYGAEAAGMARMLEGIRASVARSTELIEQLVGTSDVPLG